MQTDSLRWFQQVADGVSVTEVSEVEGVSQSGVSRALARLEDELGTPLLRRAGRSLRMTRAGAAFKRHVDAMLHDLDDGVAAVNQVLDPDAGTVKVAFHLSLGGWLVPDLLGSFHDTFPSIRFELGQIRDKRVSSVLDPGDVDLEISGIRPRDSALAWRPFLTEPLRLALPPGHRLAARAKLSLAELADEPFICLRRTSELRRQSDEMCERAGFLPTVAFESADLQTVWGLVAAGLGVAIVPARRTTSAGPTHGSVPEVPISDQRASREIGLVWSAERRLLPAASRFRQHVVDRAAAGLLPGVVA